MTATAGQCLNPAPTPVDATAVARVAPQTAVLPPSRVAGRGVTDGRFNADKARNDATRTARHLLTESIVVFAIFAFILGVTAFVAPRILDTGTHASPIGIVTLPPTNLAHCSVLARPHGLRSDFCAPPPGPTGSGSHQCC